MATISDGMTTLSEVQVGDMVEISAGGLYRASLLCIGIETLEDVAGPTTWYLGGNAYHDPARPVRIVGHLGYRED